MDYPPGFDLEDFYRRYAAFYGQASADYVRKGVREIMAGCPPWRPARRKGFPKQKDFTRPNTKSEQREFERG